MTEQEINDLILIADGYTLELCSELSAEMKKGCLDCGDSARIMQITVLKSQLEYKVSIGDYGTETQSLYNCLLDAVASYSGASISVDPNASIPNTIIDVTIIGDNRPSWFDFSWSEMESSDEVDGARHTYINPVLDGWNPSLQTGTTLLYRGVEYDMYEGGIIRLREGFGIYEGSSIRADNFQPFTAPPLPPTVNNVTIINNFNQIMDVSSPDGLVPPFSVGIGEVVLKSFPIPSAIVFMFQGIQNAVFYTNGGNPTQVLGYVTLLIDVDPTVIEVKPVSGTQFIWNRTNLKLDNSPSIGSRNITVTTDLGSTTYGASSFAEITPQTVNIRQNGTDDLILVSGITSVFLSGNNANNFVDTTLLGNQINVFNNNEPPVPTTAELTVEVTGLPDGFEITVGSDVWVDNKKTFPIGTVITDFTPTAVGYTFAPLSISTITMDMDKTVNFEAIADEPILDTPVLTSSNITDISVDLDADAVTNAEAYEIDRALDSGFTTGVMMGIYAGLLPEFTDVGLTAETTYYYRITASATGYTSATSSVISVTTEAASSLINLTDWTYQEGGVSVVGNDITSPTTDSKAGSSKYFGFAAVGRVQGISGGGCLGLSGSLDYLVPRSAMPHGIYQELSTGKVYATTVGTLTTDDVVHSGDVLVSLRPDGTNVNYEYSTDGGDTWELIHTSSQGFSNLYPKFNGDSTSDYLNDIKQEGLT